MATLHRLLMGIQKEKKKKTVKGFVVNMAKVFITILLEIKESFSFVNLYVGIAHYYFISNAFLALFTTYRKT